MKAANRWFERGKSDILRSKEANYILALISLSFVTSNSNHRQRWGPALNYSLKQQPFLSMNSLHYSSLSCLAQN